MELDKKKVLEIANQVFSDEIDGIKKLGTNLNDDFLASVKAILDCAGKVIVTGIGKSGHIANKISATLASTGTPAFFVHPAEALHGDLGMIEGNDIVIAISYSGESDELMSIIPVLKHKKVPLIAMTGKLDSSLAKIANYKLNVGIDKEACPLGLAPTTSTTACLVLGDAIAVCLLSLRGFKKEDFALSHPGGALGRRLLTTVSDLMHSGDDLPSVFLDTPLKDVVFEITKKRLGFTGVIDKNGKLLGVVTDGDLRRVLDHNVDVIATKASDIMTKEPKVVMKDSLAVDAIEMIEQFKITGFLVVDENHHLLGGFNLHDLFRAKLI